MAEFSIIQEFCHGIGPQHKETKLGVGDDAAIVSIPEDKELAVSVDTMVEGVHFFADVSPENLAHKILAVNLSDMAAMGAEPKWATMALTLGEFDSDWLTRFSASLKRTAQAYGVQIIGGDTTQGNLCLTINIMGLLEKGEALSRNGAQLGDDVYVSASLGDASLGLKSLMGEISVSDADARHFVAALERPDARVKLGESLLSIANSCLDISDGLVGDLAHICERSEVSIELNVETLPLSAAYRRYLEAGGDLTAALNGGDDYELAFTAELGKREELAQLSDSLGIPLTRIGRVVEKTDTEIKLFNNGQPYEISTSNSYQHFA